LLPTGASGKPSGMISPSFVILENSIIALYSSPTFSKFLKL
jgi:hypothetical protein